MRARHDMLRTEGLKKVYGKRLVVKGVDISYIFRKNINKKFNYYYQYNDNNNRKPFIPIFINSKYPPEKLYVPIRTKKQLIKDAKKGDKVAIEWLRTTGFKI